MKSGDTLRLRITLSIPVYGIPIPDSENPIIAAPAGRAIAFFKEGLCRVSGMPPTLEERFRFFLDRLSKGLELDDCIEARLEGIEGVASPLSLYAAFTAAAVYAVARFSGEHLDTLEAIELARLADDLGMDRSWLPVIDATRLSSIEGRAAIYRNEEEYSTFNQTTVKLNVLFTRHVKPIVSRTTLGTDLYGALIHLMGVAVLEAALRLKEGADFSGIIKNLKPIQDAVALAVWGLNPQGKKCLWVPDMPDSFSLVCFDWNGV